MEGEIQKGKRGKGKAPNDEETTKCSNIYSMAGPESTTPDPDSPINGEGYPRGDE